jgi:hypothetical protein
VDDAMLSPDHWIARTSEAHRMLMTVAQVEAANAKTIAQAS